MHLGKAWLFVLLGVVLDAHEQHYGVLRVRQSGKQPLYVVVCRFVSQLRKMVRC
jgi:hypothetical protein